MLRYVGLLALAACSQASPPSPPPSPTTTAPPAVGSSGSHARYAGIEAALAGGVAPDTTSVLVMRGATIEYERYFHGATADTLLDTRSATKSVTALGVGIALRDVPGGVSATAFALLGGVRPGPSKLRDAITIEDLLTMSSALDCDDNDDASPGNEEKMYPQPVWRTWAVQIPLRADYERDATGRGPWHYCTAGTFLLGQIIESVAKQPVDTFLADKLFAPLGIARWEFPRSPAREVMTGGGLRLRARDLATLGRLVLAGGRWNSAEVVPASFVRAATTEHRRTPFDAGYGYLFWHETYAAPCGSVDVWRMSGNGGNSIMMLPKHDAVVVVTRTHYNQKGMHQQTKKLVEDQILPDLVCR